MHICNTIMAYERHVPSTGNVVTPLSLQRSYSHWCHVWNSWKPLFSSEIKMFLHRYDFQQHGATWTRYSSQIELIPPNPPCLKVLNPSDFLLVSLLLLVLGLLSLLLGSTSCLKPGQTGQRHTALQVRISSTTSVSQNWIENCFAFVKGDLPWYKQGPTGSFFFNIRRVWVRYRKKSRVEVL